MGESVNTYTLHRVTEMDRARMRLDDWSAFFAYRPTGGVYPEPGMRRRPVQGQTPDDVAAAMRRAYPGVLLELGPGEAVRG